MSATNDPNKEISEVDFSSNLFVTGDKVLEERVKKVNLFQSQKNTIYAKVTMSGDPKENILKIYETYSSKSFILSIIAIPIIKDGIVFEISDKKEFEQLFSQSQINYIDQKWFNQRFCNISEIEYLDIEHQVYGTYTQDPYKNDVCEILSFSDDLKQAFIRIIPRLSIPELNITPDTQTPIDLKQLRKNKLKYSHTEVPVTFDDMQVCYGVIFKDRMFINHTEIIKADTSTLKIYDPMDTVEIKKLQPAIRPHFRKFIEPAKVAQPESPKPKAQAEESTQNTQSENKPHRGRPKRGQNKDDASKNTENKEESSKEENEEKSGRGRGKSGGDTSMRTRGSLRNANQESDKKDKEKDNSKPTKEPAKVARLVKEPQKQAQQAQQAQQMPEDGNLLTCQVNVSKTPNKNGLETSPFDVRLQSGIFSSLPKIYSLVELPSGEIAAITKIDSNANTIECMLFLNRIVSVPFTCELPVVNDDNTVHDRRGLRVFPGDVVKISCGFYKGFTGTVTHTRNNRVFAEFSPGGNSKGRPMFASGREIDLLEDDMGPIDV